MKTAKLIGIITLTAIIGLALFACDDGKTPNKDPCANGHTPGVAATCETTQTCTICGEVLQAAKGHNFGDDSGWVEDAELASCEAPSHDTRNCKNTPCTTKEKRTGNYPALGHDLQGAKAATCVATGFTGIGHCNRCNEDLTGDIIPIDSNNHDFSEWTQKTAATCVASERLIRVCSYNATHTEEENNGEIDPTAHDQDWTLNVIAATCVSSSKDTATCNNVPCTATNERDGSNPVNPTAHDWGTGWTMLTHATCVAKEKQERMCSLNHSHYETQDVGEINPTAHDWEWALNAIAATCVYTSKDTATCKNSPCTATNERDGSNSAGYILDWTTYNSLNGHASCNRINCAGGFAKIGDTGPAGGTIFFVVPTGFTVQGYSGGTGAFDEYTAYYLEAAPGHDGYPQWGAYGTSILDVTTWANATAKNAGLAATIGVGRKDTQIIVNHLATTEETGRAAQVCASKTVRVGGTIFTDWFLPSLGELNEMYKARTSMSGSFWSSSQHNNNKAWIQDFGNGSQDICDKDNTPIVRAIRAF